MANTSHLTQDQIDSINKELITGYTVEDLSESELKEALEEYRIKQDTKKVKVTLLVEVDNDESAVDPLKDNCVLNTVNDGFFLSPVTVLDVSYLEDLTNE